jgi:hypothetical protein
LAVKHFLFDCQAFRISKQQQTNNMVRQLALHAINSTIRMVLGQSLIAEAEERKIKAEFAKVRTELESGLKILSVPETEFSFNPQYRIFMSGKAFEIAGKNPIISANWIKLSQTLGRWDKFNCRPAQSNDFYYLQGYSQQTITKAD